MSQGPLLASQFLCPCSPSCWFGEAVPCLLQYILTILLRDGKICPIPSLKRIFSWICKPKWVFPKVLAVMAILPYYHTSFDKFVVYYLFSGDGLKVLWTPVKYSTIELYISRPRSTDSRLLKTNVMPPWQLTIGQTQIRELAKST